GRPHAVPEQGEGPIQIGGGCWEQGIEQGLHAGKGRLREVILPARQLYRTDFDRGRQTGGPLTVDGSAAAGIGKTEQAQLCLRLGLAVGDPRVDRVHSASDSCSSVVRGRISCACEPGAGPARGRIGTWPAWPRLHAVAARPATVGWRKTSLKRRSKSIFWRSWETSRAAFRLWPPRVKKSSWMPTCGTPSTACQAAAMACSSASRGAVQAAAVLPRIGSGGGRFLRSTLPFEVRGSASSITQADGTMNSGRISASR